MFSRLAIVGLLVLLGMLLVRREDVLERSRIVGRCDVVAAPTGMPASAGQWWTCQEGRLTGYPVLDRGSCDMRGYYHGLEVWYCVRPVEGPA